MKSALHEEKITPVLFQPPSRVASLDQRIREGDKFPKVEEAQEVMKLQKAAKERGKLKSSSVVY